MEQDYTITRLHAYTRAIREKRNVLKLYNRKSWCGIYKCWKSVKAEAIPEQALRAVQGWQNRIMKVESSAIRTGRFYPTVLPGDIPGNNSC